MDGPYTYLESDIDPDAPDTPLATNVYPFVDVEIKKFTERKGAVEIDDVGRREIAQAFLRAHIRALETAIARRRGLDAPPVGILNTNYRGYEPVTANGAGGTALFSQLVADYLKAVSDRWTQKTRQQNKTAYRRDWCLPRTVRKMHSHWIAPLVAVAFAIGAVAHRRGTQRSDRGPLRLRSRLAFTRCR